MKLLNRKRRLEFAVEYMYIYVSMNSILLKIETIRPHWHIWWKCGLLIQCRTILGERFWGGLQVTRKENTIKEY